MNTEAQLDLSSFTLSSPHLIMDMIIPCSGTVNETTWGRIKAEYQREVFARYLRA